MKVALATCRVLPEPDPDEPLLVAALAKAGVEGVLAAWDDPAVDWSTFTACVLRSTWNYHRAPDAFLDWLERTAATTAVWNSPALVRWNSHKAYLLELEERGVPIVPTVLIRAGATTTLDEVVQERGWDEVVIKPAVSAASRDTLRVAAADPAPGETHLARLLAKEDVLVQRYVPAVETSGERALVWIDGQLTHAIRKAPRFHDEDESVEGPVPIAPDEAEVARGVMTGIAGDGVLYGRVDLARDPAGRPCVMELELIEPSLFLLQYPPALERLAAAIARLAS